VAKAFHQRLGQRGQTGTDLDHDLRRPGVNGANDGIDDALVAKEMLAETLARSVLH
jgi:hypothetical protein